MINKVIRDIALIYHNVKPTPEEEAVVALSLLRMMQENCTRDRIDYPKGMAIEGPTGFRIAYRITRPVAIQPQ